DYFYDVVPSVTDANAVVHYGAVPATGKKLFCISGTAPDSTHQAVVTAWGVKGADRLTLFHTAACNWGPTDTCSSPAVATACSGSGFCSFKSQLINQGFSSAGGANSFSDA